MAATQNTHASCLADRIPDIFRFDARLSLEFSISYKFGRLTK